MRRDFYQLSARTSEWGSGLREVAPKEINGNDPSLDQPTELIFFIHGYNNFLYRAERIWIEKTRKELFLHGLTSERFGKIILFYWPGDISQFQWLSAVSYPFQISVARDAGKRLARYISKIPFPKGNPVKIKFVAHSLGCLLVLETLSLIKAWKLTNVEVEDVLLMAAAVPAGSCVEEDGKYRRKVASGREDVMFSSRDRVLHICFPVGQAIAREFPLNGWEAVGRTGKPNRRWTNYGHEKDCGLGHGDYWGHKKSVSRIVDFIQPPSVTRLPKTRETPFRTQVDDMKIPERSVRFRPLYEY